MSSFFYFYLFIIIIYLFFFFVDFLAIYSGYLKSKSALLNNELFSLLSR